jgi:putative ABC transport system permease protein
MTSTLDRVVHESAGEVDVVAHPLGSFDATLPPSVVEKVRRAPDTARVVGQASLRTRFVTQPRSLDELEHGSGSLADDDFIMLIGSDLAAIDSMIGLPIAEGRLPRADRRELVIAAGVGRQYDIGVGSEIEVAAPDGTVPMLVVGLLQEAHAGLVPDVAYTSLATGQELLGHPDGITDVQIELAPSIDADRWIDEQRAGLGASLLLQPVSGSGTELRTFITSVNAALTLTSVIALFVGGFLVLLTFSLAVTERVRDHGTLRALGAQPRQIRGVVVTEALALGAVASVGGLALGYAIAAGVVRLTESLFDFEAGALGFPIAEGAISVAVALATCAAAAWVPARRAAALSPVVAMRSSSAEAATRTGRPIPAVALLALGAILGAGDRTTPVRSTAVLLVLLGAVLAVPSALGPLARMLGRVTRRLAPGVGAIAVLHLVKERSRSAYTLALVMVVVAMLVATGATNASMSRTLDEVVRRQSGSGLQVLAPSAFEPEVEAKLAGVAGVASVSPVRLGQSEIIGPGRSEGTSLAIIDPTSYFEVASLPWVEGDDASVRAALDRGGAVAVPEPIADRLGRDVGDAITVRSANGLQEFEIAGTYAFLQGYGLVAGLRDAASFGTGRPNLYLLALDPGADPDATRRRVLAEVGASHDATVATAEGTLEDARAQLQGFFGIGYAMLGIAGLVGVLGLANTLVVSVLSRVREIGILRTSGARRRQVAGMVLVESSTLVLAALLLGTPLGAVLAFGIIEAQRSALGFTLVYTYPWVLLVPLAIAATAVGALAAVVPARRAARLEIVESLRFDC